MGKRKLGTLSDTARRARPRVAVQGQPEDDGEDEVAWEAVPCDALVALRLLRAEFQGAGIPIALPSQLFALLDNRTQAEHDVEGLVEQGEVRRLFTSPEVSECMVVFEQDLRELLASVPNPDPLPSSALPIADQIEVIDVFREHVLAHHHSSSITQRDLTALVSRAHSRLAPATIEAQLQAWGLLSVLDCGTQTMRFCLPGIGPTLQMVLDGRKELVTALRRRRRKEMLRKDVAKVRLKKSTLGVEFHLRDLIGRDLVVIVETAVGDLVRLSGS